MHRRSATAPKSATEDFDKLFLYGGVKPGKAGLFKNLFKILRRFSENGSPCFTGRYIDERTREIRFAFTNRFTSISRKILRFCIHQLVARGARSLQVEGPNVISPMPIDKVLKRLRFVGANSGIVWRLRPCWSSGRGRGLKLCLPSCKDLHCVATYQVSGNTANSNKPKRK